jgi:hypothetical protein
VRRGLCVIVGAHLQRGDGLAHVPVRHCQDRIQHLVLDRGLVTMHTTEA